MIVPLPEVDKTVTDDKGYVFELSKTTPFNLKVCAFSSPGKKPGKNKNNMPVCKSSFNDSSLKKQITTKKFSQAA